MKTLRVSSLVVVGFVMWSLTASAAIITISEFVRLTTPSGDDATGSRTDLFEGATVTAATGINYISSAEDLFGQYDSLAEIGRTLGADGNPGGIWSVSFQTAAPVTITGFNLYLESDGNQDRAASGFALYQGGTLVAASTLALTDYINNNTSVKVAVALDAPVAGNNWKLEITNFPIINVHDSTGARVAELDAVPEPATLGLLAAVGGLALSMRRRRR